MKRSLVSVLIVLAASAVLLLQCGKKGNPVEVPVATPTAPKITAAYPADAAGLARNTLIYVTFDRPMNHSATETALTVDGMTGTKTWSNYILIFKPDSLFAVSDTVRFSISTAAQDNNGTALAAAASYTFICGAAADTARPVVFAQSPNDSSVPTNVGDVKASLSKKIAPWSDAAITFKQGSTLIQVNGMLINDSILHFLPNVLNPSTTYTVTIDTNCVDRCGNHLSVPFVWSFKTIADTVKPYVTKTEPANGDTLVSVNAQVKIRFSEPMDIASVLAALTHSPTLHFSATWSGDTMVTLTMTDTLSFHTLYTVTVGIGAMDQAGNHLAAVYPFSFTTARGLFIACNGSNQLYAYQQNDLKAEGNIPLSAAPRQVQVPPNGARAYILTGNSIVALDLRDHNNTIGTVPLRSTCYGLAVSPDGSRLAATDTLTKWLYLIDAVSMSKIDSVQTVNGFPKGVCFVQNGTKVAALCWGRVEIYSVSNLHNAPVTVSVPLNGEELVLSPAGDRLFAATGGVVSVIRTSDNSWLYDIANVSTHPWGLAVSPDGLHLAVSCYDEDGVKVFDAQASAPSAPLYAIATGLGPKGLAYSPDGKYLYVAVSGASQLKRLARASSYAVDNTLTVGAGPWGIAVTP